MRTHSGKQIDSCELRSAEGKLHVFLAISCVTKFAFADFYLTARWQLAPLLKAAFQAFPYPVHTVLTDNGIVLTKNASSKWDTMRHPLDRVCDEHGIKHKLTKPYHP